MNKLYSFSLSILSAIAIAEVSPSSLYESLTGVPLLLDDPRVQQLNTLIQSGNLAGAAHLVTEDERFYSVTVRDWASALSNISETTLVSLSDFESLIIGVTRDDLDARLLLTGNFYYQADPAKISLPPPSLNENRHYELLETSRAPLKEVLIRQDWQAESGIQAAGLLTTRRWAKNHYRAGTNRRAVRFAFQEFLCAPISQWKNANLSDSYVRRDIDRSPGGVALTYQHECRACHAPMDAMGSAFANLDFVNDTFTGEFDWIAPKMNQNSDVYPPGHPVTSPSWKNLMSSSEYDYFGWRSPLVGVGVNSFGAMLANSKAFSECLTKRIFEKVCRRKVAPEMTKKIQELAGKFEANSYRLRWLFEQVAIDPWCIQ